MTLQPDFFQTTNPTNLTNRLFTILPLPTLYPCLHRELLRAIVSVTPGIGKCKLNLRALDNAYSVAFSYSNRLL